MPHPDKASMHAPEARLSMSGAAAVSASKMLFFVPYFFLQPVLWLQSGHCVVRFVFD